MMMHRHVSVVEAGDRADGTPNAREAATRFAALLMRQMLEPLAKPLGFFGDAVASEVAVEIERRDRDGLPAELERLARP